MGGGLYTYLDESFFEGSNNIIVGNSSFGAGDNWYGNVNLDYSCCPELLSGTGNITDDPRFADLSRNDFNLLESSPCIDAGDPSSPLDPDQTRADMGALYYDQGLRAGDEPGETSISQFSILNCFPNPFNPSTNISFQLQTTGKVNLTIFDITGREVAMLVDGMKPTGSHQVTFDASTLSSGIYFARLTAGEFRAVQKMLLVK